MAVRGLGESAKTPRLCEPTLTLLPVLESMAGAQIQHPQVQKHFLHLMSMRFSWVPVLCYLLLPIPLIPSWPCLCIDAVWVRREAEICARAALELSSQRRSRCPIPLPHHHRIPPTAPSHPPSHPAFLPNPSPNAKTILPSVP